MKLFEPHESEKAAFVKETQAEIDLVKKYQIDDVPYYHEFVEDATWEKKDGSKA